MVKSVVRAVLTSVKTAKEGGDAEELFEPQKDVLRVVRFDDFASGDFMPDGMLCRGDRQ